MKVLLDECVDRRFARDVWGHEVKTVPEMGWAGVKDGELLDWAQTEFDAFVTVDRNLPFQHDLSRISLAVVVLRAHSNRLEDLHALAAQLLAALPRAEQGSVTWVDSEEQTSCVLHLKAISLAKVANG